jgi:hypothetical protein
MSVSICLDPLSVCRFFYSIRIYSIALLISAALRAWQSPGVPQARPDNVCSPDTIPYASAIGAQLKTWGPFPHEAAWDM